MERQVKLLNLKWRFEAEYKKSVGARKIICYMLIRKIDKELKRWIVYIILNQKET